MHEMLHESSAFMHSVASRERFMPTLSMLVPLLGLFPVACHLLLSILSEY